MDKQKFLARINEEYEKESETNDLPLDLRVYRAPYDPINDHEVFDIKEIDAIWDFIKDAKEWYVDIYENWIDDNRAEYVYRCVASWENRETPITNNEQQKQTIMRNYGSTINSLYKLLAEKAEGVRICDFKNIDKKVDIYEEDNSTIFFYFDKLRGVVFDTDTDRPYISKTFHVWNNVYDDWDDVTFEKDIPLKPNEIIQENIPDEIPTKQVVVIDYEARSVNIINTPLDFDKIDIEEWLSSKGFDINNCYYMISPKLQINFNL